MYVVTVVFDVDSTQIDPFLLLIRKNAAESLANEPGCSRFDVCHDAARPSIVFLYEVYESEGAFGAHRETAHFNAFEAASADMVVSKSVTTFREVWV